MTSRGPFNASAVLVSGGKQYRVAPGDRILVDRLAADPGSQIKLNKVLLFNDGNEIKVGTEANALDVDARVIAHRRGPRIESIRYKSKKRVRVHRGGRAHLTALEIIAVGGVGLEVEKEAEAGEAKPKSRGRAKVAPRKKKEETKAKAAVIEDEPQAEAEAKEKPARKRTAKKETK